MVLMASIIRKFAAQEENPRTKRGYHDVRRHKNMVLMVSIIRKFAAQQENPRTKRVIMTFHFTKHGGHGVHHQKIWCRARKSWHKRGVHDVPRHKTWCSWCPSSENLLVNKRILAAWVVIMTVDITKHEALSVNHQKIGCRARESRRPASCS